MMHLERIRVRENVTSVIASVRGLPTKIFVTVVNKIRQYFSQKSRFFQLDRQNPSILRSTEGLEIWECFRNMIWQYSAGIKLKKVPILTFFLVLKQIQPPIVTKNIFLSVDGCLLFDESCERASTSDHRFTCGDRDINFSRPNAHHSSSAGGIIIQDSGTAAR